MLKLDLTREATTFIQSCPNKHAKQIVSKLQLLAANPHALQPHVLKGTSGYYRVKAGEYRIVFSFDDTDLKVWLIGKRNDDEIYKRFMRKN